MAKNSNQAFFLSSRLTGTYVLSMLRNANKENEKKVIILSSFLNTELIQVIYTSKLLDETNRRRLRSKLINSFESGLFIELYKKFEEVSMLTTNFYESVQSLVDDSVKAIDNLQLDYFQSLICYLFLVYFAVFLLFLIKVVLKFLKRPGRRFPRIAFSRYTIDFNVKIVLKCPTFR